MQLVHMDVDRDDTHTRCQLGPLSPGLNAICGPKGSGKTSLLAWLRQTIAGEYGHLGRDALVNSQRVPVSGTVEIKNRDRLLRGGSDPAHGLSSALAHSLSELQRDVFAGLAEATGAADSEAALTKLAQQIGFDQPSPRNNAMDRERLAARETELRNRLARAGNSYQSHEEIALRKRELEAELSRLRARSANHRWAEPLADHRRLDSRLAATESDLNDTLTRIDRLDRELAERRAELTTCAARRPVPQISQSYRAQLQELDDRLNRWRQTLRDLKSHRERIEHDATDARLDHQIGDQLSSTKAADPRAALRSLESSILNTRRQLDEIIGRYGGTSGLESIRRPTNYEVIREPNGQTHIAYTDAYRTIPESAVLPEMLAAMQKDLYEVCQQLARHESHSAGETLKAQSLQLRRCETELLQSVEKLIEERAVLLRRIADEHHLSVEQLTLAFGEWCQCHDHPHLHDWLLKDEATQRGAAQGETLDRQRLLETIESLSTQRKQAELHADECRRQLRDVHASRTELGSFRSESVRTEADILRDLDRLGGELHEYQQRDSLQAELSEIRRQLTRLPSGEPNSTRFLECVDRHIAALMGGFSREQADRTIRSVASRQYDQVDGVITEAPVEYEMHQKAVPAPIVRIAMRLAIAEAVAKRGDPISLIVDGSLDCLPAELQPRVVKHLAEVAVRGQQIVILTADQRIVQLVQNQRGWAGYLSTTAPRQQSLDVNSQLTAYANEHEADKWYHTTEQPDRGRVVPARGAFFLSDHSPIEDSPSIDRVTAADCRELGIVTIGDLLDADPAWLAERLGADGVSARSVDRWQAEARLLCSVRGLRPFDARIIVGAGVRSANQLADIHPGKLLDRVEAFLSTDRGRRILNSGSSYELSRITAWIAAAKSGAARYDRSNVDSPHAYSSDRSRQYEDSEHSGRSQASTVRGANGQPTRRSSARVARSERDREGNRERNRYRRSERVGRTGDSETHGRSPRERDRSRRTREQTAPRSSDSPRVRIAATNAPADSEARLKFYLELASPVVDAPSIGPRMASRLEKQSIFSVDQLLAANAETLADKLNHRRVDDATVRAWQRQAELVCRIPNLRGHDAQMLVACGLTSPEALSTMSPSVVLEQVLTYAQSTEGQRILRGSKEPDLAEVTDWIAWAGSCRSLNAA